MKACESCRFWDEIYPHAGYGLCRSNPPTPFIGGSKGSWPETNATDWCGEHKPKESAAAVVVEVSGNVLTRED